MESNKNTKFKALIFSVFVHSTMVLGVAMLSFETVKQTFTEMDFIAPNNPAPAVTEIEVVDSKPAELPNALPAKEEVAAKPLPVKESSPVAKAKPKVKAVALPPAPKTAEPKAEQETEVVKESPVVIPPAEEAEAEEPEQMASSDDALKEKEEETPVAALPAKEEPKTEDPQEKLPEQDVAQTEAAVPVAEPVEDEEDWTEEIRQAALPVAQASDRPAPKQAQAQPQALPAKSAPASSSGNGSGTDVRPDTDLTPRGKNPGAIYPQNARLQKIEGTAVLRFKVDGSGNVSEAWVFKSSGYKSFDEEALKTQKRWKYLPGKTGTFQKPWVFRLKGQPEEMPYRIRR